LYIYVSNESNLPVFFDNLGVTHTRGPLLEETHYYPFGLTMAGISSKALSFGEPENKYKFNGIEQNNDFDLNMYDAFYRNLDPQIGRFWQIDPKPTETISPYAAMMNNPIRFSDPLGDTTWVYNQNGVFSGVVNDKLKNQVHYIKTDQDPGKPFDASGLSAKEAKALGKAFRKESIAFIGSKTLADMRSISNKAIDGKVEVGFVGAIGKDKEIRLTALPIDKGGTYNGEQDQGNQLRSVPLLRQINDHYSPTEQQNLFLEGHVHVAAYLDGWSSGDGSPLSFQKTFGQPTSSGNADYNPSLNRGGAPGPAPSLLLTPHGVSVYGTAKPGQPQNVSYIAYKSLK